MGAISQCAVAVSVSAVAAKADLSVVLVPMILDVQQFFLFLMFFLFMLLKAKQVMLFQLNVAQ